MQTVLSDVVLSQLNAVASEEVPLAILRHRVETVTDLNEEIEIIDEMQLIIKVIGLSV